jgi:6-phosphogluconolactonase (cycloisomerase 2 family)
LSYDRRLGTGRGVAGRAIGRAAAGLACILLTLSGVSVRGDDGLDLAGVYGGDTFLYRPHVTLDGSSLYAVSTRPEVGFVLVHFERDRKSGALELIGDIGSISLNDPSPYFAILDIASSPSGDQLYAATTELLTVFGRDPDNGELWIAEQKTRDVTLRGHSVAVSPDGNHVYLLAGREWRWPVIVFRRDGDALHLQEIHENAAAYGAEEMVMSDDGRHLYVLGGNHFATLRVYGRDTATGSLSLIDALSSDDVPNMGDAVDIAISPDGYELYVSALRDDAIVVFDRDPGAGTIHHAGVLAVRKEGLEDPISLLFSPEGDSLYVSAQQGVGVFAREHGSSLRLSGVYRKSLEEPHPGRSAASDPDRRDVYVARRDGGIAHFRAVGDRPSPTPTLTATPTATATPTPEGPTRTPTRTVTITPTCTCRRTPLYARASVRPNPARSGQQVTLDGSDSVGVHVTSRTWSQYRPIDPQAELGRGELFTFTAPHVDEPTEFVIQLLVTGFGGSPPSSQAYTSVRMTILPAATPTPGGPTLTPTLTRTPTITRTPTPFKTSTPTPLPRFDLCGCIAEAPAQSCGELFAAVRLLPVERTRLPDRGSGEFCFASLTAGTYTLTVSPRCNGLGCRPIQTVVEIVDSDLFVAIPSDDATEVPTATATPISTATSTPTSSATLTATSSPTETSTSTPVPKVLPGDCDEDGVIEVDELVVMVRIALAWASISECPAGDDDGDGSIRVPEIVRAIAAALS